MMATVMARSSLRSQLHVTALHGPCPDTPDPRHRRQLWCRAAERLTRIGWPATPDCPRAIATALGT